MIAWSVVKNLINSRYCSMFIAEYLITIKQGTWAASVCISGGIFTFISYYNGRRYDIIIDNDIMALSAARNCQLYCVRTQQSKKYHIFKGFKYIQHSSGICSTSRDSWCIISHPKFHFSSTQIFPSAPIQQISILMFKANSYCIFCLKTFKYCILFQG